MIRTDRRSSYRLAALLSCGVASIVAAHPAFAQVAGDDAADEIVVTAQKREQSINDVGMAITALSADTLKNQRIVSLEDVATSIPGLSFTTSASNAPVFTLRGVGFYDVTLGASPTVSVYVDQVPLPFSILTSQANLDLQRVEVLKGPQGTLFGQNSTGGAINFVTARGTSNFAAGADLSFSRFNTFEANAYVSGPLGESVRARAAGRIVKGGNWQRGYFANKLGNGAPESYSGRLALDFTPSETLSFQLTLTGWKDKSDPVVPQVFGFQPQVTPGVLPPSLVGYPVSPRSARAADYTPTHKPFANNRFYQAALRGDLELGGGLTLTSLTSYLDFKLHQTQGGDGVAPRILDYYDQRGAIDSFYQELRISNGAGDPVRFTVGANYERSSADEVSGLDFSDNSSNAAFGIETGEFDTQQKMSTVAAFADAEYDLAEMLTVKAGARYTKAKRKYFTCYYDAGVNGVYATGGFFNSLQAAFNPGLGPYQPGDCFVLDNITSDGDPADFLGGAFSDKLKEDNVSWRAGLDFKPSSDALIYANIAKGYKAGSYPAVSAAVQSEYLPVVQESVLAFEVGTKLSFLDNRAQFSAAAFYYDYKNKQLRTKIIDPVFGIVDALVNIPKSKSQGIEVELSLNPVRGLRLSV